MSGSKRPVSELLGDQVRMSPVSTSDAFQPAPGIPPFHPIVGGTFVLGPELAAWGPHDQNLFVFAVGVDQALWYAEVDGFPSGDPSAQWSAWRSLGGIVTSPPRAVRPAESSVDVFATGANSELLHWRFVDGAWATHQPVVVDGEAVFSAGAIPPIRPTRYWESLGGVLTSPPDAVLFGDPVDPEILVFARGMDHTLLTRARSGDQWTAWDSLGHLLASPPRAVATQEEFIVFALGVDSAIWYTMGGGWHSLGGSFSSPPSAVANNRYAYVCAADSNGALKVRRWDGIGWTNDQTPGTWNDWESLGGILMTPPIADIPPEGLPYFFSIGTDSGVWRLRSLGGDWSDWESLGTGLLTLPASLVRTSSGYVRALAALGPDHQVWFQEDDY